MEKVEEKHTIKTISIVLLSLIVVIIIIAILSKVDGFIRSSYKIDVKYKTNNVIQLTNRLPMSDNIGKSYSGSGIEKGIAEYKEFTITNPNKRKVRYEIYLNKMTSKIKDMRSNYVKLYLTDKENNPVKGFDKKKIVSYYELASLKDKPGGRLLYVGSLEKKESETFILRSWVADTYILSNDEEGYSFSIDVRIKQE